MRSICLKLIAIYRYTLSPFLGQHCRFYPSCSQYTHEAIEQHGVFFGIVLGAKRLLRCNPMHAGGFDPVPCSHTKED